MFWGGTFLAHPPSEMDYSGTQQGTATRIVALAIALGALGAMGCEQQGFVVADDKAFRQQNQTGGQCGFANGPCCSNDAGPAYCAPGTGLQCDGFVCRPPTAAPPPTTPQPGTPPATNNMCGRFASDICCPGSVCQGALTCCGAACADTMNDRMNCGGCGVACPGACTNGVCAGTTPTTPTPTSPCGAASQRCCTTGSACTTPGLACISGVCSTQSTGTSTGTGTGTSTSSGGSCGTLLGACCTSGTQCQSGGVCVFGVCLPNLSGGSSGTGSTGSTATGVGTSCRDGSRSGTCIDVNRTRCSGTVVRNRCPGPTNVRCCLR